MKVVKCTSLGPAGSNSPGITWKIFIMQRGNWTKLELTETFTFT